MIEIVDFPHGSTRIERSSGHIHELGPICNGEKNLEKNLGMCNWIQPKLELMGIHQVEYFTKMGNITFYCNWDFITKFGILHQVYCVERVARWEIGDESLRIWANVGLVHHQFWNMMRSKTGSATSHKSWCCSFMSRLGSVSPQVGDLSPIVTLCPSLRFSGCVKTFCTMFFGLMKIHKQPT